MTGTDWKRERLAELRTRIRIEEVILRSLRAELEEIQWLNQKDAELRCGWDEMLSAEEEDLRDVTEEFTRIWLLGEHKLKKATVRWPSLPCRQLASL
jgi:hypothetical protein